MTAKTRRDYILIALLVAVSLYGALAGRDAAFVVAPLIFAMVVVGTMR